MGGCKLLGYGVRYITRTVGRKWGSRVLVRMPRAMTHFGAVVSHRGVKLWVDTSESLGWSLFHFNDYESAHESAFLELASNGTVLDIGANCPGWFKSKYLAPFKAKRM
jgi:hypothetical protein